MAYVFTSGSSQYLQGSTSSAYNFGDASFSVSFRINTTTTSNQVIIGKGANSASDKGWFIAIGNVTAGCIMGQLKVGDGTNFASAQRESVATVNDGAWHSVVVTIVTSSSNSANIDINLYIDNVQSQGSQITVGVYNGGSTSNLSIGCRGVPASPSNFLTGTLAEVGIWGEILPADAIAMLSKGVSPLLVRPTTRVLYTPLVRELIDLSQAMAITAINSPTVAAHPPVYGP